MRTFRLGSLAVLACVVWSCNKSQVVQSSSRVFEIGSADDPVLKMALSGQALQTITLTIKNGTTSNLTQGLITLLPVSNWQNYCTAFDNYVSKGSATAGNPIDLVSGIGGTMGSGNYFVEAVAAAGSYTLTVQVPPGTLINYLARVDGTNSDFVDGSAIAPAMGASGGFSAEGYRLDGNSCNVHDGNNSTGSSPAITVTMTDASACATTMTSSATLINDSYTSDIWDHNWPFTIGYDGDFNGDWMTDGVNARMAQPNAGEPVISGFVKFLYVCPGPSSTISAFSKVDTLYSSQTSDTTMVIYYFDQNNNYLSHSENYPLHTNNHRTHALYDQTIPSGTRKIGVVPMGLFAQGETNSSYYYNLTAQYEPAGAHSTTQWQLDDFTLFDANTKVPNGWSYYGSPWYSNPPLALATVYNPTWNSKSTQKLPLDTGMWKTYALGSVAAGEMLSARAFAASTFTDKTSFVELWMKFDGGAEIGSGPLAGTAWANLDIRRQAVPSGAQYVTVSAEVYLGPSETSSAYIADLTLWKVQ